MSVCFLDVSDNFVPHYFELLASDVSTVAPMYREDAELQNGSTLVNGRLNIVAELGKLKLSDPEGAQSQPGKNPDDVILTVRAKGQDGSYIVTLMLSNIGENNRFAITNQVIHKEA